MTQIVQIGQLMSMMETFGIKHSARSLADQLDITERNELSCREFLAALLTTEVEGRNARKSKRNYAAAHFPPCAQPLAEFDPGELASGMTLSQLEQLGELNWLDAHGNIVLAGPPGLGKTMIALGLGLRAIEEGYTVAFEKMDSFVRILDDAAVDRKAGFRLKYLRRAQLVIVDEIGYTPINRTQANKFFSFVSDAYERTSMIFTTNNEITQWVELMGDQTLTTAMLDRILHHARCYSLRGESYRLKHPETFAGN